MDSLVSGETLKNLKGTKTEQNLKNAFAGESQARNKYTFYAEVAKDENKLQPSLQKQQEMKKNMPRCGINFYMMVG